MRPITPDQALSLIATEDRVLLLLEKSTEPLCKRARQALIAQEVKLTQLGYKMYSLEVDETSSKQQELSCARIPQIRLFVRSKLIRKHVGVPSDVLMNELLTEKFQ